MIVGNFFKRHIKERPEHTAVAYKDKRVSYRDYDVETDRAAMGLLNLGVTKGDRVGVYIPNFLEHLYTYLGAVKIGAISVPVSWRFTPNEIKFVIEDAGISVLVLAPSFYGIELARNLEAVRGELPGLKAVVLLDNSESKEGMIPYSRFTAKPTKELEDAKSEVTPEDVALFIYTSGTTGIPKAAMLTHKNLVSYTTSETKATNFTGADTLLLDIPLNHVGGAVMGVISCLNVGATLYMMDMFDPVETLKIIHDEKITVMGQVPAQYAMQLLNPEVDKYDLSSIKTAIVSSQPCPTEILLEMKKRFGIFPQNAYGLTESTGTITFTLPEDGEEKLKHTVGLPIEGVKVEIMDADQNILPQGETGEIVIKGAPVMKGYWNRPDEDANVFDEKGFLHTGDMGKFDEDGYLVISGRKKEMYIRGGENVYPPEVEDAIAKHPDVFMVAVVGRPDPVMGEVGRAYVSPKPGTTPTPEAIKEFLKDRLARYKIPDDIIIREQLPLTPLGKVKKLDLYQEVEHEFKKE
jgi:fatty-acyl-CoA synthase